MDDAGKDSHQSFQKHADKAKGEAFKRQSDGEALNDSVKRRHFFYYLARIPTGNCALSQSPKTT